MLSFCLIVVFNLRFITKQVGKPDYVIASSVHPFVWEVGYYLKKHYNAKFVAEIRDIWPLSLVEVAHVNKHHPLVWILSKVEKRAYLRADAIVSSMPFAYKHICENYPIKRDKVHWMPNGIDVKQYFANQNADVEIPDELDEFLTNHWCCVYAGSFVESECIPMMLEAFSLLKDEDIFFAIIGDGHDADALKEKKKELGLDKVSFFPFVQQSLIARILSKSKCCVGALLDKPLYRYGLSLNKLNDYLLSGRPVVFACNYANVVEDAGQFAIPSNSPSIMAETILKIKRMSEGEIIGISEKSKKLIEDVYDYDVIVDNYIELLKAL